MIETDGRTIWINGPTCLARLCPMSGEVMVHGRLDTVVKESFADWCTRVRDVLGIYVPKEVRPNWDKENEVPSV